MKKSLQYALVGVAGVVIGAAGFGAGLMVATGDDEPGHFGLFDARATIRYVNTKSVDGKNCDEAYPGSLRAVVKAEMRDTDGEVIATTQIDPEPRDSGTTCDVDITFTDVPDHGKPYLIHVGKFDSMNPEYPQKLRGEVTEVLWLSMD